MDIDAALFAKLGSLTSNRCYSQIAPLSAAFPHQTFYIAETEPNQYLTGSGGLCRYSVQIDCWAQDATSAQSLAQQTRDLIDQHRNESWGGISVSSCIITNVLDGYEQPQDSKELPIYRRTLLASIWIADATYGG